MNKTVWTCLLIVTAGSVVWVAAAAPRWIDDHNEFLHNFVNHELLAILGVILVITLASSAQIHLRFNDLEERANRRFLQASRREVETSSYALIGSFFVAVIVVFLKPLFVDHQFAVAFINGFALWLLCLNIAILFDITSGIFSIPPDIHPPPD